MSGTWPPVGPTSVQTVIPAYAYEQFVDDDNIVAFFDAFNQIAQGYLDWFNATPLGVYTSSAISGPLLDWIAEGLYGIRRPALPYGSVRTIGPLNTWTPNSITLNTQRIIGTVNYFVTTDDIFKRIITWSFFKGDGQQFSTIWLKRRVMRFLIGAAGTAPNIDNTYPISVTWAPNYRVTITITVSSDSPFTFATAQVLQAAIASTACPLPFQYVFAVVVVNLGAGIYSNGGVLALFSAAGWPTSITGGGAMWSNGLEVTCGPGGTLNPLAPPIFLNFTTSGQILLLNAGDFPWSAPVPGSGQLWNPGGAAGGPLFVA